MHLLLLALLKQPPDQVLLEFMRVDEMLIDIGDDLTDYEDDVVANSFNIFRGGSLFCVACHGAGYVQLGLTAGMNPAAVVLLTGAPIAPFRSSSIGCVESTAYLQCVYAVTRKCGLLAQRTSIMLMYSC